MTIGTLHTTHELADLLAAKDSNIADLTRAVALTTSSVDATGPAWTKWLADWAAFETQWAATHDYASTIIRADTLGGTLAGDATTEETAYQRVLSVLPPFDDLVRRWPLLPGAPASYASNPTPQPTAPDTDLKVVNATTPIASLVDGAIAAVKAPFTYPKTALMLAGGALLAAVALVSAVRR